MNIAIIDNQTDCLPQIENMCQNIGADTAILHPENISLLNPLQFDLVILTGGIWYENESQQYAHYGRELYLIIHSGLPVVGICLGMLLIIATFGGSIDNLEHRSLGPKNIHLNQTGQQNLPHTSSTINVFENHSKSSFTLPDELEVWAESEDGAEIISHKNMPLIGVQFHPEQSRDPAAMQIWHSLINNVTS